MRTADCITGLRIVCALILIFFPAFSLTFYVVFAVGGLTDVLDGAAARLSGKGTEFGARFDTAADVIFTLTVLIKVMLCVYIPPWLTVWIAAIAVIKCVSIICGIARRGHFTAEHTVLNKICGLFLFAVPFCIGNFPWQPVAVLVILTCVLATSAAVSELFCICSGKEIS